MSSLNEDYIGKIEVLHKRDPDVKAANRTICPTSRHIKQASKQLCFYTSTAVTSLSCRLCSFSRCAIVSALVVSREFGDYTRCPVSIVFSSERRFWLADGDRPMLAVARSFVGRSFLTRPSIAVLPFSRRAGLASFSSSTMVSFDAAAYDPVQVELMKETIVVVDNDDNALRADSKEVCAPFSLPS